MRLPDFLIIGAAKSGTTALYSYLNRHPGVFGSDPKEPCFFDPARNWGRGLEWYANLFRNAGADQICFEASTNYTRFPQVQGVPERIHSLVPQAKLIYMVRNPVDRAYSQYVHRFTKELHPGRPIDVAFEDFVKKDPLCLDSSDYSMQIDRYLEYFDPSQLLILRQEDLLDEPAEVLQTVQQFLNLPILDLVAGEVCRENETRAYLRILSGNHLSGTVRQLPAINTIASCIPVAGVRRFVRRLASGVFGKKVDRMYQPKPMLPETRKVLIERFEPTTSRVEKLLNTDLSDWRKLALELQEL